MHPHARAGEPARAGSSLAAANVLRLGLRRDWGQAMGHDVFLSYSSLDKLAADAVCHGLEAKGIRCWIAPRDQIAGQPYGEQITSAIQSAQVMVLIFSDNVNKSHAVHNEVDLAAAANVTIVPFRLAGVDFNPELQFYLGRVHWLDAFPHPVDDYIDDLAATVQRNLTHRAPVGDPPPAPPPVPTVAPPVGAPAIAAAQPARTGARPLMLGLAGAGLLVVLIVAGVLLLHPRAPQAASSASASPAVADSAAPPATANPEQVRYFETVTVPRGPPADLDGATLITTAQLQQRLKGPGQGAAALVLVDARGCMGMPTIPGAVCLSTNTINDLTTRYPNKQQPIAFFCRDGRCGLAYYMAAGALAAGYSNVIWYRGGINAWTAAGLPTAQPSGGPANGG
jgi:rhodanese-related sulfurtransferase